MENAIEIKGLCKQYSDFALQNVSFCVPQGSIMGFIGENGAGKTTTIKAILGLIHLDGGTVRVLGKDPTQHRREINTDVGAVLDGSFFYEGMRADDVPAVMRRLHPGWDDALFADYCKRFSLPMQKLIKDYSKGMRAKLALFTAMAHHPKLLILDEATSGLDPVVRSEMLDIFQEFIEDEQHSILLSSHITSDLERVADYLTFIHNGHIVFSDTKDAVLERYAIVKCSRENAARLDTALVAGRRDTHFDTELLVSDAPAVRRAFPQLLIQPATIDDIMTFLARNEEA